MQTDDPLQARCPRCQTVFAVTTEVLEAAGGKARCGQCRMVFDAREHLLGQPVTGAEALDDEAGTTGDAGEAAAPSAPNTLAAEAETTPDATQDIGPLPLPDIPFELQDDIEARAGSADRPAWLWGGGILLACLLLAGQWLWFERNALAEDPRWRPWIERYCRILGCRLRPPLRPEQIRILSRSVSEHLGRRNALLVHLTIVNTAGMRQRWPVLELRLGNVRGFVAMRRFRADEYLPRDTLKQGFLPRTPVQITLELRKPSQPVTDFEIAFR